MPKARILISDPSGRWVPGAIGELLPCDFEKYEYLVQLPGTVTIEIGRPITALRQYYFHAGEVEIIPESQSEELRNKT